MEVGFQNFLEEEAPLLEGKPPLLPLPKPLNEPPLLGLEGLGVCDYFGELTDCFSLLGGKGLVKEGLELVAVAEVCF